MIKEELTREIEKLKVSLEAHEEQVKDLSHDLKTAKQRLEDVDKPKLTNKQFSKLHDIIENTLENFDFNNCNNYEPEFEMEIGTQISEEEYQSLIADTNPMPKTIRKLFHRYGEKFYQSYPSLVKSFKKQDQMGNATMNPSLTGTRSIQANRKFPSVVCEDSNGVGFRVHFVPRPVFAMQILPYQINCGILFDKKQSAKTWVDWHGQISNDYSDMIKQRVA